MNEDKLPPYNLEAERSVLGSCLLDNDAIDEVSEILWESDFYRGVHQEIWAAILAIYESGEPVDAVTLADHLIKLGRFKALGGDEMLAEIVGAVPHAANAKYYAEIVREKSMTRGLIDASESILRAAYRCEKTAADQLCDAEEAIFAVGDDDSRGEIIAVSDLIDETMARMELRREGMFTGVPSGFGDLDELTGGFEPGELTIVAARPSQGKTALAMDIAINAAAAGRRALICSLEMGRQALMDRLISSQAEVDGYRLQRPWGLSDDHRRRVTEAANRIVGLPLEFDFTPFRTVASIAANARRVKRKGGLGLVVIDYLSLIDGQQSRGENRQEVVARISRGLKAMARSVNVPVICLCQLNREIEKRSEKRPMLSDLRESGQIEADADVVVLLHRPEYYDPNDQPGVAELHVAKNRNGATGVLRLQFVRWCTRFREFPAAVPAAGEKAF